MVEISDETAAKLNRLSRELEWFLNPLRDRGGLEIKKLVFVMEKRFHFYPDEGKHRGRPHCIAELSRDHKPKIDIVNGEIIEGDAGSHARQLRRFLASDDVRTRLLEIWHATRPDDQRLADRR